MSIEITKLHLENYRLFASKDIEFSEYLSVFDGPNGYGKTSIFDSIEFLVTGEISRIKSSDSISGTLSYSSNCLANNPQKDVIIKGKFEDKSSSDSLVIALRIPVIPGVNRKNNPKNIDEQTETFILPQYDIPIESWPSYSVDPTNAKDIRGEFFGIQNINLFSTLHYIHQEDRLAYFKKSEAERTKAIDDLFVIKEEIIRSEKLEGVQRQLNQRIKSLSENIGKLKKEVDSVPVEKVDSIPYIPLAGGNPIWDQEKFAFKGAKSSDLLSEIKEQLYGVKALLSNMNLFFISKALNTFNQIPEEKRKVAIVGWIICSQKENTIKLLNAKNETYHFCLSQRELIERNDFAKVDWKKLCGILECSDLSNSFVDIVNQINTASKNQSDLQKSINSFLNTRESLKHDTEKDTALDDGVCPYCGYDWKSSNELEKQFESTRKLIESVIGRENEAYTQAINRCKLLYNGNCQELLNAFILKMEKDISLQIILIFPNYDAFKQAVDNCSSIIKFTSLNQTNFVLENTVQANIEKIGFVLDEIMKIRNSISTEYINLDFKYRFEKIHHEYFENNTYLSDLTLEKLELKGKYIDSLYYSSFDESQNQLQKLLDQREGLNNLFSEIKDYNMALKQAIKSYQQLVIEQIEIPFFLFSSRLLQSYQGGQGVVMESDGKSIRFSAPGGEHDVLYTMSSGQLSAVLLSFSLALNKIYAGEKFSTVLIDDPIQCMDDINMISFVELLRREFENSQIILSTHEDTFSNYIRYKFSKYNLNSQPITLRDL